MKIRKVKWKNHPILGNLELDFIKNGTDEPYENIVFAGENGTGKTMILTTLNTFLCVGSFEPFEYIEYEVVGDDGKKHLFRAARYEGFIDDDSFFTRIDMSNGKKANIERSLKHNHSYISDDIYDPRYYGCVMSKAKASYYTKDKSQTSNQELDKSNHDTDEEEDYTALKQLLIDLDNEDALAYRAENTKRKEDGLASITPEDYNSKTKLYRFSEAFKVIFNKDIILNSVGRKNVNQTVLFKKNNSIIPIDSLSTGEKQIVFRGAYLLRNLGKLNGAIIMVDEPELSMHPKWQKEIMGYYTGLFKEGEKPKEDKVLDTRKQIAQMFFATHSDHVLKSALEDKGKNLIVVLKDENGKISQKGISNKDFVLPALTSGELNYLAFDIPSIDYHTELYAYLQRQTGTDESVKGTDDYIAGHKLYDKDEYKKASKFIRKNGKETDYQTLCTYVRNQIDHPNPIPAFDNKQIRTSIELLREIIKALP